MVGIILIILFNSNYIITIQILVINRDLLLNVILGNAKNIADFGFQLQESIHCTCVMKG